MKGSQDPQLKLALKQMVIEECRLEGVTPEQMDDEAYLAGPESPFGLDSIDMLQVIVAVKNNYGVRIQNDAESRRILATINNLADFLQPE